MEIPERVSQIQKENNDYQQSLYTSLQNLQKLTENNPDQLGYIKIMQDLRDKFTNPAFFVPDFAQIRNEFFKQLSHIVLSFAHRSQNEELKSVDDYKDKIKFPVTILCIVFCQMLEMGEILPGDFLMLLNQQFGNLTKPKIYIPYLVIINYLLKELDIEIENPDDTDDTDNPPNETGESSEATMIKRIYLSKKVTYNFYNNQALDLFNFSIEALATLSQQIQVQETVQLVSISLEIGTNIFKYFDLQSKEFKNFAQNNLNSFKIILSSFLVIMKSATNNKKFYMKILQSMLKFIEILFYPINISQHYNLVSENWEYISKYFSSSNDKVEYFDYNMLCIEHLLSIKQHYIKMNINIQEYPIVFNLFKQSSRINLLDYENQINCLRIWTHYQEMIINVYKQFESADFSQIACLNSYFLDQLEFNKTFLLTIENKSISCTDMDNYIEELCSQVLLSNLSDHQMQIIFQFNQTYLRYSYLKIRFTDFLNQIRIYQKKDNMIYFTIQKNLIKKYFFYMDLMNNIFTKFGKSEYFMNISTKIIDSFSTAQHNFSKLDMEKAANVEQSTKFIEKTGNKIFNMRASTLDQCGITEIFKNKIINPMTLLNKTRFSEMPESLLHLNKIQFQQLCTLMKSIKYFEIKDTQNSDDNVFVPEIDYTFIKKIIEFCQALKTDINFWCSRNQKDDRSRLKQFYESSIYYILFASIEIQKMPDLFENYFSQKQFNIFILNIILKLLQTKVLPTNFIKYLSNYFTNLIEQNGFAEIIQNSDCHKKLRKLMVTLQASISNENKLEYSKLEYTVLLFVNQECQWLRYQALNNSTINQLDEKQKQHFVENCFNILDDVHQIIIKSHKMYDDKTFLGLKKNYFLNRIFWVIYQCFNLVSSESILENVFFKKILNGYITFTIKKKVDFLEQEEHPNENQLLFNFIIEMLTKASVGDKKLTLEFSENVLSYFGTSSAFESIQKLAKSSDQFKNLILGLFSNIWLEVLDFASKEHTKLSDFKEKNLNSITEFIMKFSKCLSENISMMNQFIMMTIENHPFFKQNSQEVYNTIIQSLVFKEIDNVKELKNVFMKCILKDLIQISQNIRQIKTQ